MLLEGFLRCTPLGHYLLEGADHLTRLEIPPNWNVGQFIDIWVIVDGEMSSARVLEVHLMVDEALEKTLTRKKR